jgi:hypothetical protein
VHLVAEGAGAAGRAQRGVQHGAAFGGVDDVAPQQRVALGRQPHCSASCSSQRQRAALVDQVLGQVGKDFGRLQAEAFKARGVRGKGLAQVQLQPRSAKWAFSAAQAGVRSHRVMLAAPG